MILLALGVGGLLTWPSVSIVIGLVGGGFLIFLGVQMLRGLAAAEVGSAPMTRGGPLTAGIVLSAGNPYFLLWWATAGLALITTARSEFGILAFVLLAVAHWSCDLIWLTTLSWASFKGSVLLGPKSQRIILAVCAAAMLDFGLYFIVRQVIRLGAGV